MDIRELDFSVRITLVLFLNRPFPVSFPFISCRFFHAILYRKKVLTSAGFELRLSARNEGFHLLSTLDLFKSHFVSKQISSFLDSCCGSVGRAVASDARGSQFKSSHWQFLFNCLLHCEDIGQEWQYKIFLF